MTEQEIIRSINKVEGLSGMTVNERLVVCGLMDEFDSAPIITVEELLHIKSRENLVIIDASNAKDAYADFKRAQRLPHFGGRICFFKRNRLYA